MALFNCSVLFLNKVCNIFGLVIAGNTADREGKVALQDWLIKLLELGLLENFRH